MSLVAAVTSSSSYFLNLYLFLKVPALQASYSGSLAPHFIIGCFVLSAQNSDFVLGKT